MDIWALGVLLYELYAYKLPFKDPETYLERDVPYDLNFENLLVVDLLKKCLEKDVDKRHKIEDVLKHPFFRQRKQSV